MNQIFEADFCDFLKKQKILIVGVGGIGCELLKCLTKISFDAIHILDLDTIDVSNLNRQFLFRKEHVGRPKATVAAEVISAKIPGINIISHYKNVKEPECGLNFFRQFDLVFMALDNGEARSYVNELCMILDLPIIEAGTQGYKGQAMLLKRELTRCYDCYPKPPQKSYAICTIRTFPEKPIHCIIWGKFLFKCIFGGEDQEDQDDFHELIYQILNNEKDLNDVALKILEELYCHQIVKLKETAPERFAKLKPLQIKRNGDKFEIAAGDEQTTQKVTSWGQGFSESLIELLKRRENEGLTSIEFEKDDDTIIQFIAAAANLRCFIFDLPTQTEFEVKQMAGNIIPAISSTNAMVAGIQVSECLKYFRTAWKATGGKEQAPLYASRELFVQNDVTKKVLDVNAMEANPECPKCKLTNITTVIEANFEKHTLQEILTKVAEEQYKFGEYSVYINDQLIYEKSEHLDEDEVENYQKKAGSLVGKLYGNKYEGSMLILDEENSEKKIKFKLVNTERDEISVNKLYYGKNSKEVKQVVAEIRKAESAKHQAKKAYAKQLIKKNEQTKQAAPKPPPAAVAVELLDDEEDIVMIDGNGKAGEVNNLKRSRSPSIEIVDDPGFSKQALKMTKID